MDILTKLEIELDESLVARAAVWPTQDHPAYYALVAALDRYALAVSAIAEAKDAPILDDSLQEFTATFRDHPVFIVGYYKSGTTLLRNLLDNHPQLIVLPSEGRYFSLFLSRFRHLSKIDQLKKLGNIWVKRLVCPVGQPPFWLLGRTEENGKNPYVRFLRYVYTWTDQIRDYGRRNLLLAVVLAYYTVGKYLIGKTSEPRFWIGKTPTNELRVNEIVSCFPQARFVHIVRDPRAIIASRQRIERQKNVLPRHLLSDTYNLRQSLRAGHRNRQVLGPERYHIVRYEDLVRNPQTTMARLADFIGVESDEILLTPTVHGTSAMANSAYMQARSRGQIHRTSLNRYELQLSKEEIALVTSLTRNPTHRYGYQLPVPRLQDAAKGWFQASISALRHQAIRLLRRRADWL